VADHFQYMPCFTFVAATTGLIAAVLARWSPVALRIGAVAAIAVLAAWAGESHRLSALYESNQTLFRHVVAHNPDSWMAHQILGSVYGKAGQLDAAAAQYREVIRIKPDHPDAYQGLAYELARKPGHRAEAIALYEKAIELRPHYSEAHYDLGVLLAEDPARRADAIAHFKVTAGLQPNFVDAHTALGRLLAQDPRTVAEAMEHLQVVLQHRPNDGTAHRDYADALARARRVGEAIPEYETALRLNPRDAVAHFHLADVLMAQRQVDAAVTHYEAALQIDPDLAAAQAHLARALAPLPTRRHEALPHAIVAVEKAPRDLDARNLLGMLYAEQGQLDRARAEWQEALRIDPNFADARRNLELLEQMMRQQAGR
jgi:tetratricopeptide (TPR) repeat protein